MKKLNKCEERHLSDNKQCIISKIEDCSDDKYEQEIIKTRKLRAEIFIKERKIVVRLKKTKYLVKKTKKSGICIENKRQDVNKNHYIKTWRRK